VLANSVSTFEQESYTIPKAANRNFSLCLLLRRREASRASFCGMCVAGCLRLLSLQVSPSFFKNKLKINRLFRFNLLFQQ
jgi:hypothetical protein